MTRRPLPKPHRIAARLRYVTANLAWQLGGDVRLLQTIAAHADVLMLVECRDKHNEPIDVAAALGPDWQVQQDLSSAARAGTVTAVRVGIKVRRTKLRDLSDKGHNVQARFQRRTVIVDHGIVVDVIAGHNPLPSTGRMGQAKERAKRLIGYVRSLRTKQRLWIWGGDANMEPDQWAATIDAPFHEGSKPMVLCWSAGWGPVNVTRREVRGSDHLILTLQKKLEHAR